MIRKAYEEYITTVSDPRWAISLELSSYLLKYIKNHKPKRILDLGSGFSSYILSQSDTDVWSVDIEEDWLEKTRQFLAKHDVSQENLVLLEDFEFERGYDLIFIDIGHAYVDRHPLFEEIERHCSGVIIFDDIHIQDYRVKVKKYFGDYGIENLHETVDKYGRYAWLIEIFGV